MPRTRQLIELEDEIKKDKFSKSRVSHVSMQKSVISPLNRSFKPSSTAGSGFFKKGQFDIGNLKLYDNDVSYLKDASKYGANTPQKQIKHKSKMFVDLLVNQNNDSNIHYLPTDIKQLEELLGTEIDKNYAHVYGNILPSQNHIAQDKFNKYQDKEKVQYKSNEPEIPEEDEFARDDDSHNDSREHINIMNQSLGKFTKTFYSHRSRDHQYIKDVHVKESYDELESFAKQLKESKREIGDSIPLFAENNTLMKQDFASIVTNNYASNYNSNSTSNNINYNTIGAESHLGMLGNNVENKAKYLYPENNLGLPAGRKDVENLEKWLDFMISKYVNNINIRKHGDSFRMRCAQLIYTICYKELVRHNATHCIERGMLMDKIWNSNITLFTVAEDIYLKKCDDIKEMFDVNVKDLELIYEQKCRDLDDKLKAFYNKYDQLNLKNLEIERKNYDLETNNMGLALTKENLNEEIERMVDYFTKTGRLPIEYMMKRLQFEKLEKEEYEALLKLREEQRLQAEEERKLLDALREDNIDKLAPIIFRRKIQLKTKDPADYNEYDHLVKNMDQNELLKMMNDPNIDQALKQAILRQLVEKYEVEVLEDEFGNKILVDNMGNPLLDANQRPIMIDNDFLEAIGAKLSEGIKVEMDPDRKEELNILANMIKGMTAEEAKQQYYEDLMKNQLDDFLANVELSIDEEDGPTFGTKSKGLNTIPIPKELQDADSYDPNKLYVDRTEYEMFKAMAHQYALENPEGAAAIAGFIQDKFGKPSDFLMVEEEYEEEIMDEDGNIVKVKKTRVVKKSKNDILGNMQKHNKANPTALDQALENYNPDGEDPDMKDCVDYTEEILADGTKVRVMKMKDGSVVRKVVNETEGMKKLKEMKRLKDEGKGLAEEEAEIEHAAKELKKKQENLNNLKNQREKLKTKEKFEIPGGLVKGKVMKKIIDEFGNEKFIEVDIENEDMDDNASVYEEVVDEFGNKKMIKIEKNKLKEINKYKAEYKLREKERVEKLKKLNDVINSEEDEINKHKEFLDNRKSNLDQKKKEVDLQKKSLADGQGSKRKQVVVKKIKEGIKQVVGKDGKIRYYDKHGKEVKEEDAFKEVVMEVPDDGDAHAEYEEVLDPKTGKKVLKKKENKVKYEVDPKTGKKVKITKKIEYELDPETGKRVAVEYDEVEDEDGNIVRVKRKVGGKPVHDNRAANNALRNKMAKQGNYTKEDEELDRVLNDDDYEFIEEVDPLTGQKVKRRVIKKDAVHKLLAAQKIKGSSKFMYYDSHGNLIIADHEPANYYEYERFPYPTICFSNRMVRIQYELDQVENQRMFLLKARKIEKKLKRECTRLNTIFTNYIAEFSEDSIEQPTANKGGLSEKAIRKHLKHVLTAVGVSKEKIAEIGNIDFDQLKDNFKDIVEQNMGAFKFGWADYLRNKILEKLKIGANGGLTEAVGFSLGNRKHRSKGNHPVHAYIKEFKRMLAEGSFQLKANQPLRNILKEYSVLYDNKWREDPNYKNNIAEFIYDSFLKKFGLKKIALGKVRDFLINMSVHKERAPRLLHLYSFFELGDEDEFTTDEINIYSESMKQLKKLAYASNDSDVKDPYEIWHCRVQHVYQYFKSSFSLMARPLKLQELMEWLKNNYKLDFSYSGSVVDRRDVLMVYRVDLAKFVQDFIVKAYRECKLHVEDLINKEMDRIGMKMPDELTKDQFKTIADLWEHYEDLDSIYNMYVTEGEHMIVDKAIYVFIKHRIIRPDFKFTEDDFNSSMGQAIEYFYNLQSTRELKIQTLAGKLNFMESEILVGLYNDQAKLKKFLERVVFQNDNEGKLNLSGFYEICTYIDPGIGKDRLPEDFIRFDIEKGRNVYVEQLFAMFREKLKNSVGKEMKNRRLI